MLLMMNRALFAIVGSSRRLPISCSSFGSRRMIPTAAAALDLISVRQSQSSLPTGSTSPAYNQYPVMQNYIIGSGVRLGLARTFTSTPGLEDDDIDEDEDEDDDLAGAGSRVKELEPITYKDFDIKYLRDLIERGEMKLQPFYQRGYKWSQSRASKWIESILIGYPCVPHVILLSQVDDETEDEIYHVFDGQQRLTSIMLYMKGERGSHWPVAKKNDSLFGLKSRGSEGLMTLKHLEGLRYKDLDKKYQNKISKFDVKCAIIPNSWPMDVYIDYFQRIQGGGTPMTVQELRRAISPGPFTELLDELATDELVLRALDGCKGTNVSSHDDKTQLILRYFQQLNPPPGTKFGKPSLTQHGLETMKHLNKEMKHWEEDGAPHKYDNLVKPFKKSLDMITRVFGEEEPFRRPVPLVKKDEVIDTDKIKKVWFDQSKLKVPLWDCTVAAFAHADIMSIKQKDMLSNAGQIRENLIHIMQTHSLFTDSLRFTDVTPRVQLFIDEITSIIKEATNEDFKRVGIPTQQRKELIRHARVNGILCPFCNQSVKHHADEHLHIDHKIPVSQGGTNDKSNLQVMHKTCNLVKSDKV